MRKSLLTLCIGLAAAVATEGRSELFKCVKDGKTTYQEQPCGGQGSAETKMLATKPSAWVGCYKHKGRTMEGFSREGMTEIRQEGGTLYISTGMEGTRETRLIMKPAAPEDLRALKDHFLGKETSVEIVGGLANYGVAIGDDVRPSLDATGLRMGLYWVRAEGKEMLMTFGPFTFDETTKVPCPAKK